jgi:uncharacterized repeat protein (TIGR03803 family)
MTKNRTCDLLAVAMLIVTVAATTTIAQAQSFSVLYNFGSKSGDPSKPYQDGIVAQGRDGSLYSTTSAGGANNDGAVFKITPSGVLTRLYSFDGTHGMAAFGGLTLGTDGNFYGTTNVGGASSYGTVFKVTPSGKLTVLYSFTNGNDGALPYAPPIQGTDGNFYGTTSQYGSGGNGSVYKITSTGKFTTLYHFDSTHGSAPVAPLVQGTDGNFYGTAAKGGANGVGVVFKITQSGKLTVLYNFDSTHGQYPNSPLIQGSDGNFYGTTYEGGSVGSGVVFRITPAGKLTVLHNLDSATGYEPTAGLVQATDGNLYSANSVGGTKNLGTVFRISPKSPYPYKVLHDFDGTTGSTAWGTLVQHTSGILYGATEYGGTGNVSPCTTGQCGVFYTLNGSLPPFVSLLPISGKVGTVIGILGQGFSSSSVVKFYGVQATAVKNTGSTFLSVTVPPRALTGLVSVTTGSTTLTSNKIFRVTPQILSFKPTSGTVGTVVTIAGVSLTQTTKVTFGGVAATKFTVNSDTQVTATVPTGAKTGKIAITTPGGVATSSGVFTVTQ